MAKIIQFTDLQSKKTKEEALQNMSFDEMLKTVFGLLGGEAPEEVVKAPVVEKTETILKNENCIINLNSDKEVSGRDLKDRYNEPAFYNKTSRGLKKAWKALTDNFDEGTTMRDAMQILGEYKIRTHSYCMMD